MIPLPSPAQCRSWFLAIGLLTVCSCSGPGFIAAHSTIPKGWWKGDEVAGKPRIVIDLSNQEVRYFKSGQQVGYSPISSGRESHETMTGSYHIIEKDIEHRSSLYGAYCDANRQIVVPDVDVTKDERPPGTRFIGASMPYFMRINGGVGMHEGYLPGYPASHGCIRLPADMARIFYDATPQGTPVEIVGDASVAAVRSGPATPEPAAEKPATTKQVANRSPAKSGKPQNKSNAWSWLHGYTQKKVPPAFGTTLYLEQ